MDQICSKIHSKIEKYCIFPEPIAYFSNLWLIGVWIFEESMMRKPQQRDFAQEMVRQFQYPVNPNDRYQIIQELPNSSHSS